MKRPTPCRYCPVLDRAHLPMDVVKHLDDNEEQFDLVQPVQACLCNSVAHANIICDPTFCARHLEAEIEWVKTTDNHRAAMGGVGKKIYRLYAVQRNADNTKLGEELIKRLDKFLEDD